MFILGKAYIMLYICTNILLVHINFDSKQPDAGLKNESSFNHMNRTYEHL